jgi:hypothetical protein
MRLTIADGVGRRPKSRARAMSKLCAVITAFVIIVTPMPAYAEGSFTSHLDGVRSGFASRTWVDSNRDNVSTTARLAGCSRSDGANFFLEVNLYRVRSLLPNVNYGSRNVSACRTSSTTASWGDPNVAGTYFLRFYHYTFGTVSASTVVVTY